MNNQQSSCSAASVAFYAFLGGSVFGAVLALILVPKLVRETRKMILDTDQ